MLRYSHTYNTHIDFALPIFCEPKFFSEPKLSELNIVVPIPKSLSPSRCAGTVWTAYRIRHKKNKVNNFNNNLQSFIFKQSILLPMRARHLLHMLSISWTSSAIRPARSYMLLITKAFWTISDPIKTCWKTWTYLAPKVSMSTTCSISTTTACTNSIKVYRVQALLHEQIINYFFAFVFLAETVYFLLNLVFIVFISIIVT